MSRLHLCCEICNEDLKDINKGARRLRAFTYGWCHVILYESIIYSKNKLLYIIFILFPYHTTNKQKIIKGEGSRGKRAFCDLTLNKYTTCYYWPCPCYFNLHLCRFTSLQKYVYSFRNELSLLCPKCILCFCRQS